MAKRQKMNQVICPHCGKEVELSEAIYHEVEEKITKDLKAKHQQELKAVERESAERARKQFEEETNIRTQNLENELNELRAKKKTAEEDYLNTQKQLRELKSQLEQNQIELEKKLAEERERTRKEEESRFKMEKLELEKKLSDTQKALEEAQRKSKQGSQQLQGEVLELDLENQLSTLFPEDEITPVPKGFKGADIMQKVRSREGKVAGVIIWEAKRAKWNDEWVSKLKEDMIQSKSTSIEAILVVETLPEKLPQSGYFNGIWVSSYNDVLTIAKSVRILLKKVAQIKGSRENTDEKLEYLYQFIVSDDFKLRLASHIEQINILKRDLDQEKRIQEKIWKKREVGINRLERITNVFDELETLARPELLLEKTVEVKELIDNSQDTPDEELKLLED